jgi:hypothetical protein
MNTTTLILIGAFVVCALLYVMRRRARLTKDE